MTEQPTRPRRDDDGICTRCGASAGEYHRIDCSCHALGHEFLARRTYPGGGHVCGWCGEDE